MESSQQEIINRILKDATEESNQIIKKAKESAELMLEKQRQTARDNAQKEATTIIKRAENQAEIIRGKTASDIKRQAGWMVLSEKNRLIQNVLDEVKQRLVDLKKNSKYVPLLEKLTVDAGSALGGGKLTVLLNEKDLKLNLDLDKLSKKISAQTGVKTNLFGSKENIQSLGVVVKTADDKIFVDNTFETILKRQEKELKTKIAKILFSSVDS